MNFHKTFKKNRIPLCQFLKCLSNFFIFYHSISMKNLQEIELPIVEKNHFSFSQSFYIILWIPEIHGIYFVMKTNYSDASNVHTCILLLLFKYKRVKWMKFKWNLNAIIYQWFVCGHCAICCMCCSICCYYRD